MMYGKKSKGMGHSMAGMKGGKGKKKLAAMASRTTMSMGKKKK